MIRLRILTPSSNEEHRTEAVFLPGTAGAFEVLKGHAPLISTLTAGDIRWRSGEKEDKMRIRTGIVRVEKDEVTICCEI